MDVDSNNATYEECSSLPFFAFHGFVKPSRMISCYQSHKNIQEDCSCHQSSAARRREHTEHRENFWDRRKGVRD